LHTVEAFNIHSVYTYAFQGCYQAIGLHDDISLEDIVRVSEHIGVIEWGNSAIEQAKQASDGLRLVAEQHSS
jgi:hypothetical protein